MICSICKMDSFIDSSSQLQRSCRGLLSINRWCLQLAGGILLFWRIRGWYPQTKLTSAWAVLLFAPPTWVTEQKTDQYSPSSVKSTVVAVGDWNLSKSGLTNTNVEILKWEPLLSGLSVIWEKNRPSKKESRKKNFHLSQGKSIHLLTVSHISCDCIGQKL